MQEIIAKIDKKKGRKLARKIRTLTLKIFGDDSPNFRKIPMNLWSIVGLNLLGKAIHASICKKINWRAENPRISNYDFSQSTQPKYARDISLHALSESKISRKIIKELRMK